MKKFRKYRRAALLMLVVLMVMSLFGCGSGKEKSSGKDVYQEYVIGIMDANYLGKYEKYMELTGAVQQEAQKIYEANIQDFALEIEEALSVKTEVVSKELTERFMAVGKTIYSQVKYQAVDVIRDGDTYTVSVEIEPVDFFGTVNVPFSNAVEQFNSRAKDGEFDGMTDDEYETAYAETVVSSLESRVSSMSFGSKITVDITLDYDKENNMYMISDEQMESLDGKVVDMVR